MVQQLRGIRNHCWLPAGEDPSNSSFRRAMRKAAGTVSIVDKDAKCYTWLGNMRWFTGQFPKRMNPNKLAKDFCFQIAIAILCWVILLIFWSSWSSILGEFGVSMKPMCQPWSNELIKVRCLKTWGVLKKNTMWLHRKTERSWNRRVFWTFLHFDSKCFLMGFDIPMCVGASRKPSNGKKTTTIPAKSMVFLPSNHHKPTWTIVSKPPWPAQVVDICLIFTPMRTRTPPRRLASPMAWPTRMARDRSRRDGNDIESGVFLLNSYRKPWKLDWKVTLPETNIDIAPEKWWFPIGISFPSGLFSGDIWIC